MKKNYLLFCLSLLIISCEKDNTIIEENLQNPPKPDFIISTLKSNEIKNDKKVYELLFAEGKTTLTKSSESNSSIVYDTINNLVIDITTAKKMVSSNGKYHSYTFPIISNDEILRNIFYSLQADGSYKVFKIVYNLTDNEKDKLKNGLEVNLYGKGELTPLYHALSLKDINSKSEVNTTCVFVSISYCSYGNHAGGYSNGIPCPGHESSTESYCTTGSSDGGGYTYTAPGDGTSGGGSPGGGSTTPGDGTCIADIDGNCIGDNTTPTSPNTSYHENNIDRFFVALGEHNLQSWWVSIADQLFKNEIITFLNRRYTVQLEQFLVEACLSKLNGGDVNFEEKIIKEDTFKQEPCFIDNLHRISTGSVASNYFNNFSGETPVAHLKFSASSFGNTTNAITHPPQNFVIEIEFNTDRSSRPNADIARTIIHEVLHAEMFRKLLSLVGQGSLSNLTHQHIIDAKDSYPGIHDYWTRYVLNNATPSSPQHELMAQHLIGTITSSLIEFDSSLSPSQAEALAWTGLKKGVTGDSNSEIDPLTGLVIDPLTGANESSVAWTNLSQAKRLSINQIKNNFMLNTQSCQ